MSARDPGTPRPAFARIALAMCGTIVILAYVWIISIGRWSAWPATTNYYDQLATSFREGHLNLDIASDAQLLALLALPNPYEPDARRSISRPANTTFSFRDMSLYKAKLYLYWGPAPALLLTAIKLLYAQPIGDQTLAFVLAVGLFGFQSAILIKIRQRYFGDLPLWTLVLGIILVGLINPIPSALIKPRIYETAIMSGQCFYVGGLYFALDGLDRATISPGRLFLAGALWAFAAGSRITMAFPISLFGLAILLRLLRTRRMQGWPLHQLAPAAALCIPLLAGAVILGWYNFARFGNVIEFGFRYAITMLNQNKYHDQLFSLRYVLPNAYMYLINPPEIGRAFPFVVAAYNAQLVQEFNSRFDSIYNVEKIVGLIYSAPFLLFGLVPASLIVFDKVPTWARKSIVASESAPAGLFRWFLTTLSAAVFLGLLVMFAVFYATTRYMLDAIPSLALLSVLGLWQGYQLLGRTPRWRTAYSVVAGVLVVLTIVVSLLLSFSVDPHWIDINNPHLLPALRRFFDQLAMYLLR